MSSAGSAITWLVDNLQLIKSPNEVSLEASKVEDAHGIFFVPAFTGLYAPRWNSNARG